MSYQSCGTYSQQIIHQQYTCNLCKCTPILGTRWFCFTCRKDGKEFNLCNVCNIMTYHSHCLESVKYNTEKIVLIPDPNNDPREPNDVLQPMSVFEIKKTVGYQSNLNM